MNYRIDHRRTCRICTSPRVKSFLRFDDMPFTDEFVASDRIGTEFRAQIEIFWCEECRTVQTQHDVEVSDYYRDYQYTVSASNFARQFMTQLAEATWQRFDLQAGDSVIEIGSGDGFQLACFQKLGARVLGYEPSDDLTRMSLDAGVPVVKCLFHAGTTGEIPQEMRPAQVVLLTYTFDHLPEPLPFLHAVRDVLDPDRGVLLIEVHDLAKIMQRRETCLFEHEHSIYLTAKTMDALLARAGFRLLTTMLLPEERRRGNSLLIAAALAESRHQPDVSIDMAVLNPYDQWQVYAQFGGEVQNAYANMRAYVHSQIIAGKSLAGYGAGGRGVMTLAMAGLTHHEIAYLCDRNSSFHGLYTPGSHIPVVPPEQLVRDPVDELIVFSFGYLDEIRQQQSEFVARGGQITSMLELLR